MRGGLRGARSQLVEADGDGLAEVHGGLARVGGNLNEHVAPGKIFAGEAVFFRAEDQGDGRAVGAPAFNEASEIGKRNHRLLGFAVGEGSGADDKGTVCNGLSEGACLYCVLEQVLCADRGQGFAPVGFVGRDDGELMETEVGHGTRGRADVERIARGDKDDADGMGVKGQETIVVRRRGTLTQTNALGVAKMLGNSLSPVVGGRIPATGRHDGGGVLSGRRTAMAMESSIKIGALKKSEVLEADRIMRVAFGTFLGLPNPAEFMGDRQMMIPRVKSGNVKAIAARDGGRLVGTNLATRWGAFAFFGPLTVLPEYWDRGVAQRLLEATQKVMDGWGVRHSGLFTFAQSAKHVGLYQKFGYWPQHLTAILTRTPQAGLAAATLLSEMRKGEREAAIARCEKLTSRISKGLDLTEEIRAVLAQGTGDVVVSSWRGVLEGFAVCMQGAGSEGGSKTCYVKFGAARGGNGAAERFDRLLDGCEAFAAARGAVVEAGVNLARGEAFCHLRSRGYRVMMQGVAMQRPHVEGFNRPHAWVMDDWR